MRVAVALALGSMPTRDPELTVMAFLLPAIFLMSAPLLERSIGWAMMVRLLGYALLALGAASFLFAGPGQALPGLVREARPDRRQATRGADRRRGSRSMLALAADPGGGFRGARQDDLGRDEAAVPR